MRLVAWLSSKYHEHELIRAWTQGMRASGATVELRTVGSFTDAPRLDLGDLGMVIGIHIAREPIKDAYLERGIPYIHLDKGFYREPGELRTKYWRMSVNGHQPTPYLSRLMADRRLKGKRARLIGWRPTEHRGNPSGHILYAAPTGRTLGWYGRTFGRLPKEAETATWAGDCRALRKRFPDAELLFRPKPARVKNMEESQQPLDTTLDDMKRHISKSLEGAHASAVWTSAAAVDSVLAGIPVIPLHPETLTLPLLGEHGGLRGWPDAERQGAWFRALSYCQWTLDEMRSGEAWKFTLDLVEQLRPEYAV